MTAVPLQFNKNAQWWLRRMADSDGRAVLDISGEEPRDLAVRAFMRAGFVVPQENDTPGQGDDKGSWLLWVEITGAGRAYLASLGEGSK